LTGRQYDGTQNDSGRSFPIIDVDSVIRELAPHAAVMPTNSCRANL